MDDIELIILQELDELDHLNCPKILVRGVTDAPGKFSTNCSLGDEKCLCKGLGEVILVTVKDDD